MDRRLRDTKILLDALEVEIRRELYRRAPGRRTSVGWRGAGVALLTRLRASSNGRGAYREPHTVLTPYAHEAGWLFERIDRAFAPLVDECIREDIIERLGVAAEDYSLTFAADSHDEAHLLKIVLAEARDILREMQEGEFPFLAVEKGAR